MRLDYEKLSLDRNGILRSDGDEITHPRTIETYLKSIQRTPDGYEIKIGHERRPIQIEDTAYFVRQVDIQDEGVRVHLTNGSQEWLPPDALEYGPPGRLVARIHAGTERAKFLHAAYHELLNAGEFDQDHWKLVLPSIQYELKMTPEEK